MPVPETQGGPDDRAAAAEREALVKLHEEAAAFYREQLASPGRRPGAAGTRVRGRSRRRRLRTFGYGYAPAAGRDTLQARFADREGAGRPCRSRAGWSWSGTAGGWWTGSGTG